MNDHLLFEKKTISAGELKCGDMLPCESSWCGYATVRSISDPSGTAGQGSRAVLMSCISKDNRELSAQTFVTEQDQVQALRPAH